jgi:DNA-directed RNA polymerase beta subunit
MPWNGYNYEDAIIISERILKDDVYTSIHIYEKEVEARETKYGVEEITKQLPGVKEDNLSHLDESGIVKIGTYIKPGMIMVGKVSPKGDVKPTPEERLIRNIFGEKSGHVIDSSLKAKASMEGVVIDVKVFTKKGYEQDDRAKSAYEEERFGLKEDYENKLSIIDREEVLALTSLLSNNELVKDASINNTIYEAGNKVNVKVLRELNKFFILATIDNYDEDVKSKFEEIKNRFQKEKERI